MSDRRAAWGSVVLILCALVLFANGFHNEFLNFDDWWIVHHERMGEWLTPRGLYRLLFDFSKEARMEHGAEYLPLRDLSAALQSRVFGANPLGYHVVQTVLFGLSCTLLFRFLLVLGAEFPLAGLAALLFLAHPIHVESVTWLSGHKDVLSLLFVLACLLAYAKDRMIFASVLFLLAVASKYHVLVTPLLLPFVDRCLERPISWKRFTPFIFLALYGGTIAFGVAGSVQYDHMNLGNSLVDLLKNLPVVLDTLLGRLLVPIHLQLFYPFHPASGWFDLRLLRGAASLIFLAGLLVWGWRKKPLLSLGVWLLPVGLIPMFRAPEMHFLADRYLLLPSLGLVILLTFGFAKVRPRPFRGVIFAALLVFFSVLTIAQNRVWRTSLSLWEHAERGEKPVHGMVLKNLSVVTRDGKEWARSARYYRQLLSILPPGDPSRGTHLTDLGFVQIQLGDLKGAEETLRRAVAVEPTSFNARMNLGSALAMQRKYPEGRKHFENARKLDPSNPDLLFNLARLELEVRRVAEAERILSRLRTLVPSDPRLAQLEAAVAAQRSRLKLKR